MPNWKGRKKPTIRSSKKTLKRIQKLGYTLGGRMLKTLKKINAATQEEKDNSSLPIEYADVDDGAEDIAYQRMFDDIS